MRSGIIYVYTYINGERHRYSTGKEATEANIEWAKEHWQEFIDEQIAKKAKAKHKRRSHQTLPKKERAVRDTKHGFVRGKYVYVYAYLKGRKHIYSTGKEATEANLEWAKANWKAIVSDIIAGKSEPKVSQDITIAEFAERSFAAHERKPSTIKNYRSSLKTAIKPLLGNQRIKEITTLTIREWMQKLAKQGKSADTIKTARVVLATIIADAVDEGILERNPVKAVRPPKVSRKEIDPFSLEETRLLLSKAEGQIKEFLIVSFFTGMRTGEALGLKWEHIDFGGRKIHIKQTRSNGEIGTPKTDSSIRKIDMLDIVAEALKRQYERTGKAKSGFVFLTHFKQPYKYITSIRDKYAALLKECEMKYRKIYSTRHTFASVMLSEGEVPIWVSHMLGHKSLTVTLNVYSRYVPRENETHAAFLKGFFDG